MNISPESQRIRSTHSLQILLVEDDDDEARLMRKIFERDHASIQVHRVDDGIQALAYLRRQNEFSDVPRPDLILLDLNLPLKDGRQVLKEIKEDADLQTIPVVILTNSDCQHDIVESYQRKANSYVTKPVDLSQFREMIRMIKEYWFSIVKLPTF